MANERDENRIKVDFIDGKIEVTFKERTIALPPAKQSEQGEWRIFCDLIGATRPVEARTLTAAEVQAMEEHIEESSGLGMGRGAVPAGVDSQALLDKLFDHPEMSVQPFPGDKVTK